MHQVEREGSWMPTARPENWERWGLWALFISFPLRVYVCVCISECLCVKTGPFGFVVLPAVLLFSYFYTHTVNKGGDAHSQSGTKARFFFSFFQRRVGKIK